MYVGTGGNDHGLMIISLGRWVTGGGYVFCIICELEMSHWEKSIKDCT